MAAADDDTQVIETVPGPDPDPDETRELGLGASDDPEHALLSLRNVKSGYGALPVLHGIDLDIAPGQTAVLLGLNGAGKTTTAMNIAGALDTWSGTITFDGEDATDWNTRKAVKKGITLIPEGRRVFGDLSVEHNLLVGSWSVKGHDAFEAQRERVFDYFPRLRERASQLAGTLSGGEQQMLAVGRGLMSDPKLLIIDEASMGLAPVIVKDVFEIVREINEDGVTVLLIEQNIGALEVADIGLVMEQGKLIARLEGDQLEDPSEIRKMFLG